MAQYRAGTVSVVQKPAGARPPAPDGARPSDAGPAQTTWDAAQAARTAWDMAQAAAVTVTGLGTKWLSNVEAGDLFNITDSGAVYEVEVVVSDTELELTRAYSGVTEGGAAYAITRDFTPRHELPYLAPGDDSSAIFPALVQRLDSVIDGGGINVQGGIGDNLLSAPTAAIPIASASTFGEAIADLGIRLENDNFYEVVVAVRDSVENVAGSPYSQTLFMLGGNGDVRYEFNVGSLTFSAILEFRTGATGNTSVWSRGRIANSYWRIEGIYQYAQARGGVELPDTIRPWFAFAEDNVGPGLSDEPGPGSRYIGFAVGVQKPESTAAGENGWRWFRLAIETGAVDNPLEDVVLWPDGDKMLWPDGDKIYWG